MVMDEAAKILEPEERISLILSCKTMATWIVPDRKLMGPLPYMAVHGMHLLEMESELSPKLADWARAVRTAGRARELAGQIRERRAAEEVDSSIGEDGGPVLERRPGANEGQHTHK